jgi:hypothetical protein
MSGLATIPSAPVVAIGKPLGSTFGGTVVSTAFDGMVLEVSNTPLRNGVDAMDTTGRQNFVDQLFAGPARGVFIANNVNAVPSGPQGSERWLTLSSIESLDSLNWADLTSDLGWGGTDESQRTAQASYPNNDPSPSVVDEYFAQRVEDYDLALEYE